MKRIIVIYILLLLVICIYGFKSIEANKSTFNTIKKSNIGVGYSIRDTFVDQALAYAVAREVASGNMDAIISDQMIAKMTYLSAGGLNISNLSGLEVFSNLKTLKLFTNKITTFNSSDFPNLIELNLSQNQLTTLDTTDIINLTKLEVAGNDLVNVNVSQNTSLNFLNLNNNKLTTIDLSNNLNLIDLNLAYNKLTTIDLSNNLKLPQIYLSNNELFEIDLSKNVLVEDIFIENNKLKNIKLPNNNLLRYVGLSSNELSEIDISRFVNIFALYLDHNKINQLDISNNTEIIQLGLNNNNLKNINLDNNVNLKYVYLNDNMLTSISLDNNLLLQSLDIQNNQLTSLPNSLKDLDDLEVLNVENNLLPTNYHLKINSLNLTSLYPIVTPTIQDKLKLKSTLQPIEINSYSNFINQDLSQFVELASSRTLSSQHNFIFTNYVDELNNPIDISDYFLNNKVIKEGIVFAQIRATGNGLFLNNSDNAITSNKIQFVFKIPPNSFVLSFDLNGGSGNIKSQNVLENTYAIKPNNPLRTNYKFMGWNTKEDGSGINWNFNKNKMPPNNLILYAKWQENDDQNIPKTGSRVDTIVILITFGILISVVVLKKEFM